MTTSARCCACRRQTTPSRRRCSFQPACRAPRCGTTVPLTLHMRGTVTENHLGVRSPVSDIQHQAHCRQSASTTSECQTQMRRSSWAAMLRMSAACRPLAAAPCQAAATLTWQAQLRRRMRRHRRRRTPARLGGQQRLHGRAQPQRYGCVLVHLFGSLGMCTEASNSCLL